jgi:hypothetical protein
MNRERVKVDDVREKDILLVERGKERGAPARVVKREHALVSFTVFPAIRLTLQLPDGTEFTNKLALGRKVWRPVDALSYVEAVRAWQASRAPAPEPRSVKPKPKSGF